MFRLHCNNCPEKIRCMEYRKKKKRKIDVILSYIANETNYEYCNDLKSSLPIFSRCEVVLEKELIKRTEALENIKKIIETRFKPETEYMSLSFKEYDEIIEDIDKIVSEVLND